MKVQELLENRIKKVGQHLNKEKHILDINKGKEKMVMERASMIPSSQALRILVALIVLGNKKGPKGKPGFISTQAKKAFDGKQGSSSTKAKKLLFHHRLYGFMMIQV
nr:hypothetical protein [Tanacetum cinerariifolium]